MISQTQGSKEAFYNKLWWFVFELPEKDISNVWTPEWAVFQNELAWLPIRYFRHGSLFMYLAFFIKSLITTLLPIRDKCYFEK
jgi:hypothetical protein